MRTAADRCAVVATLLFAACGAGPDAGSGGATAAAIDELAATITLEIGEVEGEEAYLFGQVSGLALDAEGRIYVADRQASEVRVFTPDGAHLFTFGRAGSGPGEMRAPCCLAFDRAGLLWLRDAGNARQPVAQKILELAKRADKHAQLVIGFPGHQITLHDFGKFGDRRLENGEVPVVLLVEPDPDESRHGKANGRRIDQGNIALDHAVVFKLADTAQTRARRQTDPLGKFLVRHSPVRLQLFQDLAVDSINHGISCQIPEARRQTQLIFARC